MIIYNNITNIYMLLITHTQHMIHAYIYVNHNTLWLTYLANFLNYHSFKYIVGL